jgi:hypothetical protein
MLSAKKTAKKTEKYADNFFIAKHISLCKAILTEQIGMKVILDLIYL